MADNEKLSILLIEDNGVFLNIAEEMLAEHKVDSAKTAKDGLDKFRKMKPDITFLDIALPDGNGHDVLQEIRQSDDKAYVIMMTASRLKEDVLKAMEAGAEGYITKPFSHDMVNECIKEYFDYKVKIANGG